MSREIRTPEGEAATEVVLRTFQANGLLLAAGGQLAGAEGLSAACWQALGAVALAGRPLTVPQIARRMGLTRQAVQVSVNRLFSQGLLETMANPDHRRSPLISMTPSGGAKYAALDRRQVRWINDLAAGLDPAELASTARVLEQLSRRLERNTTKKKGEVSSMRLPETD
jgi:DNA-binding MarR family transcriptional regulator